MEQQIIEALGTPTVVDLLGERVYLSVAPEGVEAPYCRFFEVIGVYTGSLSGVNMTKRTRYQFDFFGRDTAQLKAALVAVLNTLKDSFSVSRATTRTAHTQEQELFHSILDISIWE